MTRDGTIPKDMQQYLIPRYVQSGKLKGNPKIHKKGAPLRTIVSGMGTPTEHIAELTERELAEFVETSPSYIRDTTDFIAKLKSEVTEPLPDDSILFCFDVCKLYPSIPKKEGLEACSEALLSRSKPIVKSADGLLKMIETVLENNSFALGDKHYMQTDGVAIGSKLGKNFACTYMRKWDEQLMNSVDRPVFYKRFIDDGFGIWTKGVEALQQFVIVANSIHPNIKVELRFSQSSIEFLDTLVILENGRVYTDLYVKPTDKRLYLRKSSCHPPSTKRSLAYGLGLRIRRICEKNVDYLRHRQDLKTQLRKRGYSGTYIEGQLRKVDRLDRSDLLRVKQKKSQEDRVPLVLTYSNLLPDIHAVVKRHMSVLHQSDKMRRVFTTPPLVAYRRDRNLCDTLVHGKTNKLVQPISYVCEDGCASCDRLSRMKLHDTEMLHSHATTQAYNCRTRNVVYAISCRRCSCVVYVGETERTLKERMTEHLRDIRLQRDKPINGHFATDGHSYDMAVFSVLEKVYGAGRQERLIREAMWIKKLRTNKPYGCNVKDVDVPIQLRT